MKKYYAKEIRSDYFDYEMYYNEDMAEADFFWAGGNRSLVAINNSMVQDVIKGIDELNYYYDLDEEEDMLDAQNHINGYFKSKVKMGFVPSEAETIIAYAIDYNNADTSDEEYEAIKGILKVIYGIEFKSGELRGSVQGDWYKYICPVTMSDEALDYIEAVLFATGTEFEVTEEPIESAKDFDTVESHYYYTAAYNDTKIKEDLASQLGDNVRPEDIVLLKVSNSYTTTHYDYEEV